MRRIPALLLAFAGSLACGTPPPERIPAIGAVHEGPAYDRLYPKHVEVCALSQIRPLDTPAGGSGGHAVMFLSGACPRADAEIPLLESCAGGGSGVSVNKMFKNVNWVAVPGRRVFLHGLVGPDEPVSRDAFEATVTEAVRLRVFRGVEIQRDEADAGPVSEEFIARKSLGTDYALAYGRTVFCAKLPVTKLILEAVIAYLNQLNASYATGEADYEWSGYYDNCTHTLVNALAAAGVWEGISVNAIRLRQLFNLAVPANEFVNLAELANDGPLDFAKLRRDELRRRTLEHQDWLPTRHGGLIQTIPAHEPNDVYDPRFKLFVLESPLLRGKTKLARQMLSQRRYWDIEANLKHFRERYTALLERESARDPKPSDLHRRYLDYLRRQLEDVDQKLRARRGRGRNAAG
jgi:hypothetical protein